MMSKMKDMLDGIEIADELQYSFVSTLNITISDSSDILSMANGVSRDMTTQEKNKDLSKVECFRCHEYGHHAFHCPKNKGK